MEGEVTSLGEILFGLVVVVGALYGAIRYAKYKKANRKPSTGGGGGSGDGPKTKKH
jgi:hypothetical protein